MAGAQVAFVIKFKKETIPLTMPLDMSVRQLKSHLETLTGIPATNQKLVHKTTLKDDATLREVNVPDRGVIMLFGSTQKEVETIEKLKAQTPASAAPRVKPASSRPTRIVTAADLVPLFGRIEVITELPNAEKARQLLASVSDDPGIVGLMKKYNWHVGTLAELSPAVVDKLGYNQNKGERIALRLRFEEGFRSFSSLIEVMLHELAHMVWSEHDNNFHAFNRQLSREYKELNWKLHGHTLSGKSVYQGPSTPTEEIDQTDVMAVTARSSGQRLGGDSAELQHLLSPREMAANAALLRLTEREKELARKCGQN